MDKGEKNWAADSIKNKILDGCAKKQNLMLVFGGESEELDEVIKEVMERPENSEALRSLVYGLIWETFMLDFHECEMFSDPPELSDEFLALLKRYSVDSSTISAWSLVTHENLYDPEHPNSECYEANEDIFSEGISRIAETAFRLLNDDTELRQALLAERR